MTTQIADQIRQFIQNVETHLSQSRGAGILRLDSPMNEEERRIRRECEEDDRLLSERIREMARMQAKHRPETASRLFKLSELVGKDFVASLKLWKDVRSELEVVAVQASNGNKDPVERLVRDYIQKKIGEGWNLDRFKSEGIATAIDRSEGAVRGTSAWKTLSAQKKAPPSKEAEFLRAAERGDWKSVEALQRREKQQQRQQHRS